MQNSNVKRFNAVSQDRGSDLTHATWAVTPNFEVWRTDR